jgi:RNA polymerase sigma factor (sigma-70 family)
MSWRGCCLVYMRMTTEQPVLVPKDRELSELDWNAVYADQLPRVYAYLHFRLGTASDVEDLVSRTFEKAWRSRDRYKRDLGAFSTWLLTIARNVGIDYMKSRRYHLPIDAVGDLATHGTPQGDAERDSDLVRLTRLIALLPERERELIALKYGADIDNLSVARLTGLSASNVATILHRAVRTLRARW